MAVRDLLWCCPRCSGGSLRPAKGGDGCAACGTVFRRERGDRIVACGPDGETESRPAAAWQDALDEAGLRADGEPEPATLREALPSGDAVRYGGELIGWVERFGPRVRGAVRLTDENLAFRSDAGKEVRVAIEDLTSIQPSSRKLLLGRRGAPTLALEVPGSSLRGWEIRLQKAVARRWAALGRGEVSEYQPRIVAR